MLTLEAVSAGYGPTPALRELSLTVSRGELVCLLGANGAGKSTALKTISGLVR
ncbi:MAG: ABC transporter ATP-binding protein, partial [Candidatus Rokuibacteriota bacterium]